MFKQLTLKYTITGFHKVKKMRITDTKKCKKNILQDSTQKSKQQSK